MLDNSYTVMDGAVMARLCRILSEGYVWCEERGDVAAAVRALGLDLYQPEAYHPLVELYHLLERCGSRQRIRLSLAQREAISHAMDVLEPC